MKPTQKGGLKLINPEKTGFKPVFDMINSPNAQLKLLTYKSRKGFIISLTVDENDSEYLGLVNKKFTKKITNYILKVTVITPDENTMLPPYHNILKLSESRESYFNEAKHQQNIWIKSIIGAREELCPSIANFSLIDNYDSKLLMNHLIRANASDLDSKQVFKYLFNVVNDYSNNYSGELGIIVMANVENSITLGDFLDLNNGEYLDGLQINDSERNNAIISVLAKIERLFIDIGVIHFDLHADNALIYVTPTNEIKSVIIDFGRASNILDDTTDHLLTRDEKAELIIMRNYAYDKLFNNKLPIYEKGIVLNEALNKISETDYNVNHRLFVMPTGRYQIDWHTDLIKDRAHLSQLAKQTYESIRVINENINYSTIKGYIRTKKIINFDVPYALNGRYHPDGTPEKIPILTQFVANNLIFPTPPPCQDSSCIISGGKRYTKSKISNWRRTRKSIK